MWCDRGASYVYSGNPTAIGKGNRPNVAALNLHNIACQLCFNNEKEVDKKMNADCAFLFQVYSFLPADVLHSYIHFTERYVHNTWAAAWSCQWSER